jgi:dihydrofolate reductase
MAKLIYSAITSLDGYVEDKHGGFDWAAPDEEVHRFINGLERQISTYLYGRRMYDTMSYWQSDREMSPVSQEFAEIWRAADKIVYSRSLERIWIPRARIERAFDPVAIKEYKNFWAGDVSIGGAELAGRAIAAGLVDECHLFLVPAVVGGGKRALPDDVRLDLELLDEHRFGSGVVHLHYAIRS